MATYEELERLVGELKRSAIDAWMCQEYGLWKIVGDHYEMSSTTVHYTVTRPYSDGQGGGDWHTDVFFNQWFLNDSKDAEFRHQFDDIRQMIDAMVAPWRDLPSDSDIKPVTESCRQVARRLSGGASVGGGTATGGGDLAGSLKLIEQYVDSMSGAVIASYKAKFLIQLAKATGGFLAISGILGANVAAQEGMWGAVRQNVADILEEARKTLDGVAAGTPVTFSGILKGAGWAVKGIGLFAVGGGKLVAELAGLGLEVVADAAGDEPFKKDPGTYAAAIDALRATLESLNAQVFHEEQLIDQNFIRNLANIRNDKSSYDLSQPPISSSRGVIIINPSLVDEIITQVMPDIASELEAAAKQASALSTYQAVVRDGRIGLGASGPSDRFSEMAWLLYELLQDLAWEVRNGAKNLELAVGDLEHHNKRSAAQLSEFAEKIKAGSSYNPWD